MKQIEGITRYTVQRDEFSGGDQSVAKKSAAKTRIAECFIRLVTESTNPQKRVSTTDIAKSLGIDRKSFYRHFENTTDLVVWVFRSELADALTAQDFGGFHLEYPDPSLNDIYPDLPFYARSPLTEATFDQSEYTKALCALFNGRHEYYRRILSFPCYIDFYFYLLALFEPAIRAGILQIIGPNRFLPEAEIDFLAEYHTVAFIGRLQCRYVMKRQSLPEGGLERMWNYSHETLQEAVDRLALPLEAKQHQD